MMDGMPVVNFCDFITKKSYAEVANESASTQGYEAADTAVKNIFEDCLADLHSSGSNAVALVDQCKCFLCSYRDILGTDTHFMINDHSQGKL